MSMNKDMRHRACSSGKQRKQEKEKKRAGAQDGSPPTQETQQKAGRRAVTAQPGGDERRADARGAHATEARAGKRAGKRTATRATPAEPLRAPRREQAPRIGGQQRAAGQERVRNRPTGRQRTKALQIRARGFRPAPPAPPEDLVERRAHVEQVERPARPERVEHEPNIPEAERNECASERSAKVGCTREEASIPSLRRALLYPAAKKRPKPRGPNFGREIVPGLRVLQSQHDERDAPEPRVLREHDVLNSQARDLGYAQETRECEEEGERLTDLATREQFRSHEEEQRVGQRRPMVSLPNSISVLQ